MSTTAVVLIVVEDRSRREALRETLEGPLRVLEAAHLDEVRSAVEGALSPPDLILSDLRSAKGEGLTLYRRLRADPHVDAAPVLLVPPAGTEEKIEANGDTEPVLPESVAGQDLRRLVGHHLAAEGLSPGPPLVPDAPLPEAVEAVVAARLGDPAFTAQELAEAVGLSRRQLTRRMKDTMGTTPAAFIRRRRLKRAEELLATGAETVKQVAAAVGFASPSAFAKAFRDHAGAPPSVYAERHGE
ncbi:MAG: helix-turn-helix domain-containing protein [Salinibacter sp.]|uniref:helix-turn-helix domain-containing protein n=1 Tax=Salinibacter sp. TaxID=2065818 RepID=UPI0035D49A34